MFFKFKSKELKETFEAMGKLFSLYDVMKEFKLEKYYDDRGIVVHPDYRGHGIAQRLFGVR
jgi:GNAT superfamily N-acetyltransferase